MTQQKVQRIKDANVTKRVAICGTWLSKMANNWEFDPRKVYWADEKFFTVGLVAGGNRGPCVPACSRLLVVQACVAALSPDPQNITHACWHFTLLPAGPLTVTTGSSSATTQ